jgi:hypothetical protein
MRKLQFRTRSWCRLGLRPGQGVVAANAGGGHRAMTAATADDAGGLLMPARPECLLRPTPSGFNVVPMAQQSPRFRGRDTTWATPATSTQWPPGSRCEPLSRRSNELRTYPR